MIRLIYFISLVVIPFGLFSQNNNIPLLERDVTICINGVTAQTVLTAIAQQADFVFSYSPSVLPEGNVSICIEHQPVRLVLNILFNGAIDYSIKGKYIILKKSISMLESQDDKKIVEGYIIDYQTGNRIDNASIYDKNQMLSTITNKYGYFRLEIPNNVDIQKINISKQGYVDTLLMSPKAKRNFFDIKLATKQIFEKTNGVFGDLIKSPLTDSLSKREWLPSWLLTLPIRTHLKNVSDTLFKKVQVSFLPFVGTNKLLTANTANDFSFNIIAGYTQEVRRFEIGGILNIVRKNVKSLQLSGVGNIVGGSFKGLQAAGTFNIVRDSLRNAQFAGVGNIVGGSVTGLQASGTFNICNKFHGLQLSGTLNFSTKFKGAQITSVWNESRVGNGLQLSGVTNTTSQITGVQMAGVTNIAKDIEGTQVAGVVNVAKNVVGVQVAGVTNIASHFDGYQVGTINIADTCSGVPFGFLSIVKRGYHKLEFSFDEMRVASAAFRTGVPLFHNIFTTGVSTSFSNKPLFTYGYGLGTSIGNPSKLLWDIDISMNGFIKNHNWSSENTLYKVYTGLDWRVYKKTSIAFGISYNLLSTNTKEADFNNTMYSLIPYTLSDKTSSSGTNLKTWFGGKIAIRFF
ncbi:MAG: hypothetical protein HXX16_12175 [Bacteroidales bacterium]|nr:hypothetical protein [Bacteroidales bacterium]